MTTYITDGEVLVIHKPRRPRKMFWTKIIALVQWILTFMSIISFTFSFVRFLHAFSLAVAVKPEAILPYALLYGLGLVLLIYIGFNYSYSSSKLKTKFFNDFTKTVSSKYKERIETSSEVHEELEKRRIRNESLGKNNILKSELP